MLNIEKLRREFEQETATTQRFWVPKLGENIIRVLPPSPKSSDDLFYRRVWVHFFDGFVVFCLSVYNEDCPICGLVEKLKALEMFEAIALIKKYTKVERYLMNIWDFEKAVLKQWLAPKTVRVSLVKIILDKDWGDITDLRSGRNVTVEKADRGNGIVYEVRPKPLVSSFDLVKEEDIPVFDEILQKNKKSADELLMMIGFGDEEEDIVSFVERKRGEAGKASSGRFGEKESSSGSGSGNGVKGTGSSSEGREEVKKDATQVKDSGVDVASDEVKELMNKVLSILGK